MRVRHHEWRIYPGHPDSGCFSSREAVASEILRRTNGLSPRISEDEALRILLVDMTRDYLKAKSKAEQTTE